MIGVINVDDNFALYFLNDNLQEQLNVGKRFAVALGNSLHELIFSDDDRKSCQGKYIYVLKALNLDIAYLIFQ